VDRGGSCLASLSRERGEQGFTLGRQAIFLEAAVGFVGEGAFDENMLHQFLDGEFEVAASLSMTESLQDVFSPAFSRPQGSENGSIGLE
jgi:hypothetical protein